MKRVLLLLVALAASVSLSLAQERTVTGVVTDAADGSPLPLANIMIKGTQSGTVTDNEGRYTLRVPGPDATLVFFYTGYESKEVVVADQTVINVKLGEANEEIDQVVVTAFGSQKKSSLTGAIASVEAKELEKMPGADVAKALEGRMPGVQIQSASGTPGAGSTIRIRGIGSINSSNSPLIIVDGAPYTGGLNTISSADIESYSVLKDAASAALYGARAANGVILITTKKGRTGQTVVNYDGRFGVNMRGIPEYDLVTDPAKYYQLAWRSLEASYRYAKQPSPTPGLDASKKLYEELGGYQIYKGINPNEYILPDGSINPKLKDAGYLFEDEGWNDWHKALFAPRFRQEHNLSVSKAFEKTKIYFSASYLDDKGYSLNSYFTRISGRINVQQEIYSWLDFSNNFQYVRTTRNAGASGLIAVNPFGWTRSVPPIYPIYEHDEDGKIVKDEDGNPVYEVGGETRASLARPRHNNVNPVATQAHDLDGYEYNVVREQATFVLKLPWHITGSVNFSYDGNFDKSFRRQHPFGDAAAVNGRLRRGYGDSHNINFNQILDWYWGFLDEEALLWNVKLGHESSMDWSDYMSVTRTNLFEPKTLDLRRTAVFERADGSKTSYRLEGYFAQTSLEYLSRYFLSGSFRMDGSSVFHPDHRWGAFWSVGASWIASKEPFFASALDVMNNLKLRLSYGLQGNDYLYTPDGDRNYTPYQNLFSVTNDGKKFSVSPALKGNEKITWEKNYNFSAAAEFGFLQNMFSGQIEFFTRTTRDMLFNLPLPAASGYKSEPVNFGDMRNMGVEFALDINPLRTKNMNLVFNFNITHYKNKVLRLPERYKEEGLPSGTKLIKEGGSMYQWNFVHYAGVDRETGLPLYEYRSGKDAEDWHVTPYNPALHIEFSKHLLHSALPDAQGGFGVTFDCYGVDLSAQFSYAIGGLVYDGTYAALMSTSDFGDGWHKDMLDSWTENNKDGKYPRLQKDNRNSGSSDRFLITASHVAFKNAVLGYTFPEKWTTQIKIQKLRIYAVCDNVWLWSARKGFDPRMVMFGSTAGYAYTPIRTIAGGIQLTF